MSQDCNESNTVILFLFKKQAQDIYFPLKVELQMQPDSEGICIFKVALGFMNLVVMF